MRAKEVKWLSWRILAGKTGRFQITVRAQAGAMQAQAAQWLSVVATRDPKHEYEDAASAWQPYPARAALQKGNSEPISNLQSLPSASLKGNLFGITAHLPRDTDDEVPFAPAHVTDGDPATCWASRWWRIAGPRNPESIELDLGRAQRIGEVRFLPAWKNSGVPSAFTIALSEDGRRWQTAVDETNYQLQQAPDGDPLRVGALRLAEVYLRGAAGTICPIGGDAPEPRKYVVLLRAVRALPIAHRRAGAVRRGGQGDPCRRRQDPGPQPAQRLVQHAGDDQKDVAAVVQVGRQAEPGQSVGRQARLGDGRKDQGHVYDRARRGTQYR